MTSGMIPGDWLRIGDISVFPDRVMVGGTQFPSGQLRWHTDLHIRESRRVSLVMLGFGIVLLPFLGIGLFLIWGAFRRVETGEFVLTIESTDGPTARCVVQFRNSSERCQLSQRIREAEVLTS